MAWGGLEILVRRYIRVHVLIRRDHLVCRTIAYHQPENCIVRLSQVIGDLTVRHQFEACSRHVLQCLESLGVC